MVEVTAAVPLLNSESGSLGHVMTNRQIVDLPLNGRGFNELARLTPGVVLLPGTGNVTRIRPEFVNGTTISGVRGRQVSYFLDGTDTSEQHQGGSWIQTSVDALQEFSVQQNAYSAEQGRSGSFFNATTKSGTNQVRGTLYEFLRNEKLDARNFFGTKRDLLKRNQFGASAGGPIVSPQDLRRPQPHLLLRQLRRHARAAGQHGEPHQSDGGHARRRFQRDREYHLRSRYGPPAGAARRQPFAGNRIPSDRLSPQAAFFNKYLTTAAVPGGVVHLLAFHRGQRRSAHGAVRPDLQRPPQGLLPLQPERQPPQRTGQHAGAGHCRFRHARPELHGQHHQQSEADPAQRIPLQHALRR